MLTELEERIMEVISNCPKGVRLRNIGSALHMWHCNLVKEVNHLEALGKIERVIKSDPANMECYNIFKIKE